MPWRKKKQGSSNRSIISSPPYSTLYYDRPWGIQRTTTRTRQTERRESRKGSHQTLLVLSPPWPTARGPLWDLPFHHRPQCPFDTTTVRIPLIWSYAVSVAHSFPPLEVLTVVCASLMGCICFRDVILAIASFGHDSSFFLFSFFLYLIRSDRA